MLPLTSFWGLVLSWAQLAMQWSMLVLSAALVLAIQPVWEPLLTWDQVQRVPQHLEQQALQVQALAQASAQVLAQASAQVLAQA